MARILVAITGRDEADLAVFALRFAGHSVVSASSVEEAISLAKQKKPDLILLEAHLPGSMASDAYQLIKSDPGLASIPVIYLLDKDQQAELPSAGVTYIFKPFEPDDLVRTVEQHLKRLAE